MDQRLNRHFEPDLTPPLGRRQPKLSSLIRLRWLAIGGQTAAIVLVNWILGFPLPLTLCLSLIGVSIWLNLFLRLRFSPQHRLEERWASVLLGYDILQLSALLYLTGGMQNPFAILLLAPVVVSAAIQSPRFTLALGALVFVLSTVLTSYHYPLPWQEGSNPDLPFVYIAGVWVALQCCLVFTSVYAFIVADESRQLADALNATEMVLAHEQHLSALDGLAAAAAHELGTPLATITLVSKELLREVPEDIAYHDDIGLLQSQAQRCREILSKLTSLSTPEDGYIDKMPLSQLIDEVADPYRPFDINLDVRLVARDDTAEPVGIRNPAIVYGLGNLVENAVDYARQEVVIDASWDANEVTLSITDDGPGIDPGLIDRIGDPYVSTRKSNRQSSGGLGLGFFIAKTLLGRSGAAIDIGNLPTGGGAVVRVSWPRDRMEQVADAPTQ